jgi:pimeloyl-ACP methyl ester carboxylesterase
MTLFCFDFAGCGKSEGEFISLGWHERDDVNVIVNYLRQERKVNTIGLWGRSMGAATALLHSNRDPSIAGLVLDSAFSDLQVLVQELARTHTKVPSFLVSAAISLVRGSVQSRANFDIYELKPIQNLDQSFIPALFAHGIHDTFI